MDSVLVVPFVNQVNSVLHYKAVFYIKLKRVLCLTSCILNIKIFAAGVFSLICTDKRLTASVCCLLNNIFHSII